MLTHRAPNRIILLTCACALCLFGMASFLRADSVVNLSGIRFAEKNRLSFFDLKTYSGRGNGVALTMKSDEALPRPRVAWDIPLKADLSHIAGIRLWVRCRDFRPIRQFSLYVLAGGEWQAADVYPELTTAWQELYISKAQFQPDGNAGVGDWSNCTLLRIGLWRGGSGACVVDVAGVEWVSANAAVAVVRVGEKGTSCCKESYRYASQIATGLSQHGVYAAVFEERTTTAARLKPYAFVFCPYLAGANKTVQQALTGHVAAGGKLCVFYDVPPLIQQAMHLPKGDYLTTGKLPAALDGIAPIPKQLPMADYLSQHSSAFFGVKGVQPPLTTVAWWRDVRGKLTPYSAVIRSPQGFWMTHVYQGKDPENGPAFLAALAAVFVPTLPRLAAEERLRLAKATLDAMGNAAARRASRQYLEIAETNIQNGWYPDAQKALARCFESIRLEAAGAVPAKSDEIRAMWGTQLNGLSGVSWKKLAPYLQRHGVNLVFLAGGTPVRTNYPSAVAPQCATSGAFAETVRALYNSGISVHVWMDCMNLTDAARQPVSKPSVDAWAQAGRLQKGSNGAARNWLCPSQTVNRQAVVAMAAEAAALPGVSGIHLDFIRYPDAASCICDSCRAGFEQHRGAPCTNWPACIGSAGPLRKEWQTYRAALITQWVREISAAVRRVGRGLRVSAAVFPEAASARSGLGQDWNQWVRMGLVDFVCPMNYQKSAAPFQSDVLRQCTELGDGEKLLPGIGVSTHRLTTAEVQQQINAARRAGTAGYALFRLDLREAKLILPQLK